MWPGCGGDRGGWGVDTRSPPYPRLTVIERPGPLLVMTNAAVVLIQASAVPFVGTPHARH